MAIQKTLGGDRLGSGKKMKVALKNFERSTHDLSRIWRSTMAPGTLVPFFKEIALPGDTWDIRLNANVMTLPTLGPLFGSFKMQLDLFQVPIRLYNARLHMNELGIGMNMSNVKFPLLKITSRSLALYDGTTSLENWQVNQSSLLAYLGFRGNGYSNSGDPALANSINAIPMLAYWDIYKNYYANKQEEIGAYLTGYSGSTAVSSVSINGTAKTPVDNFTAVTLKSSDNIRIAIPPELSKDDYLAVFDDNSRVELKYISNNIYTKNLSGSKAITLVGISYGYVGKKLKGFVFNGVENNKMINVKTFPLKNIDNMREKILKHLSNSALVLDYKDQNGDEEIPYYDVSGYRSVSNSNKAQDSQNGLALKTYQSDIFNNWLSKEWIDGTNGINAITAIDTSSGSFTIDTLNLSKKVYDMLNRVAVSGGSYEDWLQAVYSHNVYRRAESPIYLGGLSKEVIFQEVVSNSGAEPDSVMYQEGGQPLGTLAGRGKLSDKHKGGYIVCKVDEPSYIIGIVSLTPRVDYSQGRDWDINLKTLDDLHKPSLDQIGFQDLVTEQMAFWERHFISGDPVSYSAGKQPAWINYMTSYNKTYGGFADPNDQMFMTLNRRYEMDENFRIKDLTTYIDPMKFNYIFADTRRDAQNFWVQIASDVTARRKMSAKVMPNL
jgi:hypothetical protein